MSRDPLSAREVGVFGSGQQPGSRLQAPGFRLDHARGPHSRRAAGSMHQASGRITRQPCLAVRLRLPHSLRRQAIRTAPTSATPSGRGASPASKPIPMHANRTVRAEFAGGLGTHRFRRQVPARCGLPACRAGLAERLPGVAMSGQDPRANGRPTGSPLLCGESCQAPILALPPAAESAPSRVGGRRRPPGLVLRSELAVSVWVAGLFPTTACYPWWRERHSPHPVCAVGAVG